VRYSHSYSKRGTLDNCLRKYFCEYYASAKKLPFDAERKELIRGLKEFTTTSMLAGESLHWFIEQRLKKGISSQSWAERTALDRFDRASRYSRDPVRMAHMAREKYPPPMLVEFYYQDSRAEELAAAARDGLVNGIRHFLHEPSVTAVWNSITAGEHWVEKRVRAFFALSQLNYSSPSKAHRYAQPLRETDVLLQQRLAQDMRGIR
jgi:hypothetical protein